MDSLFDVSKACDRTCTVTLLLRPGLIPPLDHEQIKYPEGALIYIGTKIYKAKVPTGPAFVEEDWEYFDERVNWQGQYSNLIDYTVGDLVMLNDRLYRKVKSGEATNTSDGENPLDSNWEYVDDLGTRFPPWATNTTAINVTVNCDKMVETHPASGGKYWVLDEEVMFGAERVNVSDQHVLVRDLYHKQEHITQIYTIKIVHVLERKQQASRLNPNPEIEKFIGITLGVYMLPPGVFGDIMSERLDIKDVYIGDEHISSSYITYSSQNSICTPKLRGTECSLLPKIHPVSGASFPAIYTQWRAAETPIIVHGDNIKYYLAITQPPQYTQFLQESADYALKCNMVDLSDTAFKHDYCKNHKTKRLFDPEYTLNSHDEWVKEQYSLKSKYFQLAGEKWKVGTGKWEAYLNRERAKVTEFYKKLDAIVVKKVNIDVWFNSKDNGYSKCKIGKKTAADIKKMIDELNILTSESNHPLQALICSEAKRVSSVIAGILG